MSWLLAIGILFTLILLLVLVSFLRHLMRIKNDLAKSNANVNLYRELVDNVIGFKKGIVKNSTLALENSYDFLVPPEGIVHSFIDHLESLIPSLEHKNGDTISGENPTRVSVLSNVEELIAFHIEQTKIDRNKIKFLNLCTKYTEIIINKQIFRKLISKLLNNAILSSYAQKNISLVLDENVSQNLLRFSIKVEYQNNLNNGHKKRPFQTQIFGSDHMILQYITELKGNININVDAIQSATYQVEIPVEKPVKESIDEDKKTLTSQVVSTRSYKYSQKVLVLENQINAQETLRKILEPEFNLVLVQDITQTLEVLDKDREIGVIVMDLILDGVDVKSFVNSLKTNERYFNIGIVLLSNDILAQDEEFTLNAGVDDVLTKPFASAELVTRVSKLLDIQKQRLTKSDADSTSPRDMRWLKEVENKLKDELGNSQFKLSHLCFELNLSERQLRRKLKKSCGLNFVDFYREIKLKHALSILENGSCDNISQVAYKIGFESPSYFAKLFAQRFGKKVNDYF